MSRSDILTKAPPAAVLTASAAAALLPFLLLSPNVGSGAAAVQPTLLAIPGSFRSDQRQFVVRPTGFIYAAADTNVTLNLYAGSDPVAANNTLIASTGALAVTAASGGVPFWLEAKGIFDSIAGNLYGQQSAQVGANIVANAALSNVLAGLNGKTEPVFYMSLFAQFSVANAGTYINLKQFPFEG
jgi:hypothetical protein